MFQNYKQFGGKATLDRFLPHTYHHICGVKISFKLLNETRVNYDKDVFFSNTFFVCFT